MEWLERTQSSLRTALCSFSPPPQSRGDILPFRARDAVANTVSDRPELICDVREGAPQIVAEPAALCTPMEIISFTCEIIMSGKQKSSCSHPWQQQCWILHLVGQTGTFCISLFSVSFQIFWSMEPPSLLLILWIF